EGQPSVNKSVLLCAVAPWYTKSFRVSSLLSSIANKRSLPPSTAAVFFLGLHLSALPASIIPKIERVFSVGLPSFIKLRLLWYTRRSAHGSQPISVSSA